MPELGTKKTAPVHEHLDRKMEASVLKLFISWSGEFSQKVAKKLSIWIPTIIQSVEVFYSSDDIAKGENWGKRLDNALSDCSFGIICLTPENIAAPWIHFEAGALSAALNARISAVMLGVNPSELKGPLTRYQNTVFNHEDFFQLFQSINDASETPLKPEILKHAFDNAWEKLEPEVNNVIQQYAASNTVPAKVNNSSDSDAIQEILRLLRKSVNKQSEPPSQTSDLPIQTSSRTRYDITILLGRASSEDVLSLLHDYLIPSGENAYLKGSTSLRCKLYISTPELEELQQNLFSLGVSSIGISPKYIPPH